MFLRLGGRRAVAVAFVVPLVVLLATVRTTVGFWDTGDLQTVAWIAGIPYPTGYPLYVGIGWVWTHVVPFASVAARLNALSALAVASGAATVTAIALLLEVSVPIAIVAGWTFAFAHSIWYRATYADAHPLGFAIAFIALAWIVRWALRGEARALVTAIVLGGVALAVDNTTVLILSGAAVAACGRRPPLRPLALAAAAAAAIVVVAYAYLPLRSAQVSAERRDPTLALGVAPGRPFWDDHHPASVDGFRSLVAGTDWGAGQTLTRLATFDTIGRAEHRFGPHLSADFSPVLLLVALIGLALTSVSEPVIALGLIVAAIVPALFGASYPVEADPGRYGFALSAVVALGAAVGASRAIGAAGRSRAAPATVVLAALLLLVVGVDLRRGGDLFAARSYDDAARLGERVAAATRDGAVVVAAWDYATPLAYRAYVEHAFGTRIVLCGFAVDYAADYARWLPSHQIAVVSPYPPEIDGLRTVELSDGDPGVYALVGQ